MNEARLNLAVKSLEGASLVEADGELGPWTIEAFSEAMHRAADSNPDAVILDLSRVESMDVGALKVLNETRAALGPDRKLCAVARGAARRVFEITRFDEIVGVFPRLQDALDAIGGEAVTAGQGEAG